AATESRAIHSGQVAATESQPTRRSTHSDTSLLEALTAHIARATGVTIPPDAWRPDQLPEHLRLNIRVLDATGKTLAEGRDVGELRRALADQATRAVREDGQGGRRGIRSWGFGELPGQITVRRGSAPIPAWPGREDVGDTVTLRLFETPAA